MRNIKLIISYNGAGYAGFQIQNDKPTIQGVLQNRLSSILRHSVRVFGCSRTDAGVHALCYCLNFHTENPFPLNGLVRALNNVLPSGILVMSAEEAYENFHARHDCKGKTYVYRIYGGKSRNVFLKDQALYYPREIDLALLNQAAAVFKGEHNFAAFHKREAANAHKSTIRKIYGFEVTREGSETLFTVCCNGFLYNMVRIMCGSLLDVNENKLSAAELESALKKLNRADAGRTLPACGLYLKQVFYTASGAEPPDIK